MPEARAFFGSIELSDVTLRVRDLERVTAFYRDVIGLNVTRETNARVELSAPAADGTSLISLEHAPDAIERPRGTAGLFHTAILVPGRAALGRAARRLIERDVEFGTGDHGVSEALYLDDPEGNGVEIYADRAVTEWPPAQVDGQVTMYTKAVDVQSLLAADGTETGLPIPLQTRIGHLHLCVANLAQAEAFFAGELGFPVRQRTYPGALFLGRDGYHHHLGANVWRSHLPAAADVLGLKSFAVRFADYAERTRIIELAEKGGHLIGRDESGARLRTPDGIELLIK